MTMLDAALTYANKLHLHVLPLSGKVPITAHGVSEASIDPEQINEWWAKWPNANIGLRGGRGSFVALDIDPSRGGEDSLRELQREHGNLPDTWESVTGKLGTHLYYIHPLNGPDIPMSNDKIAPGVDIRAAQSYCVAPPSVHPETGRVYEWDRNLHPFKIQPAPCPGWLVELALKDSGPGANKAPDEWREIISARTSRGRRNTRCTQIAGLLLRRYVDPFVTLELVLSWNRDRCDPPLSDAEVVKTVNSIAAKEARRRNGRC